MPPNEVLPCPIKRPQPCHSSRILPEQTTEIVRCAPQKLDALLVSIEQLGPSLFDPSSPRNQPLGLSVSHIFGWTRRPPHLTSAHFPRRMPGNWFFALSLGERVSRWPALSPAGAGRVRGQLHGVRNQIGPHTNPLSQRLCTLGSAQYQHRRQARSPVDVRSGRNRQPSSRSSNGRASFASSFRPGNKDDAAFSGYNSLVSPQLARWVELGMRIGGRV